jgi:hypothetical protein
MLAGLKQVSLPWSHGKLPVTPQIVLLLMQVVQVAEFCCLERDDAFLHKYNVCAASAAAHTDSLNTPY